MRFTNPIRRKDKVRLGFAITRYFRLKSDRHQRTCVYACWLTRGWTLSIMKRSWLRPALDSSRIMLLPATKN